MGKLQSCADLSFALVVDLTWLRRNVTVPVETEQGDCAIKWKIR